MRLTHLSRACLPFALFLGACAIDNSLGGDEKDPEPFDTGGEVIVDTDTTDTVTTDTSVTEPPQYCQDRHFPAEAIPMVESCPGGPATPDWEMEPKWEIPLASGSNVPAVVGQLTDDNGDGVVDELDDPDVVVMDVATTIHAVRGSDGREIWSKYLGSSMGSIPTIGDVDGDGFPEVVLDSNYATTALNGRTGGVLWVGPSYSSKDKGSCGAHGMADLDGDGVVEVYLGSQIIDGPTGTLISSGDEGDGLGIGNYMGMSIAADLDGDGVREVVVGNAAYRMDGTTLWANGGEDGSVAIADLDLDGLPELVMTNGDGVTVMDHEGNELWFDNLGDALPSAAAIADIDGDGAPEVIVPTANRLVTFRGDGSEFWDLSDSASSTDRGGASAYDLDGDGSWEVIWAGPSGLRIIEGASGETLGEYPMSSTRCAGSIPVVDLDGDYAAEIVAVDASGSLMALSDTDGFTTARTVWNQADYATTNVLDDGTIPSGGAPSWEGDNNFRAGPSIPHAQSLYPVIRDVCADECDRGTVWIWYAIGNNGNLDVTGNVNLQVWGTTPSGQVLLTTDTWSAPLPAGWLSESAYLEIPGAPADLTDITLLIVGGGNADATECDTGDDLVAWGAPVCSSEPE